MHSEWKVQNNFRKLSGCDFLDQYCNCSFYCDPLAKKKITSGLSVFFFFDKNQKTILYLHWLCSAVKVSHDSVTASMHNMRTLKPAINLHPYFSCCDMSKCFINNTELKSVQFQNCMSSHFFESKI